MAPSQRVPLDQEDHVRLGQGVMVPAARQRVRVEVAGVQAGTTRARAPRVALYLYVVQPALAVGGMHVKLHRAAGQARQRVQRPAARHLKVSLSSTVSTRCRTHSFWRSVVSGDVPLAWIHFINVKKMFSNALESVAVIIESMPCVWMLARTVIICDHTLHVKASETGSNAYAATQGCMLWLGARCTLYFFLFRQRLRWA